MAKGDWLNLMMASLLAVPIVLITMKAREAGVNLRPAVILVSVVLMGMAASSIWRRISPIKAKADTPNKE